jgi:hypothetical protein
LFNTISKENLEIITNSDVCFNDLWEQIYEAQSNISPFYSETTQKYYRQRPIDENCKVKDQSFVLFNGDEGIFAFRGALIETAGAVNIMANEVPCVSIEKKNKVTKNARKLIHQQINSLLEKLSGKFIVRDYLLNNEISILSRYLLKKGATPTPIFTQIVDLEQNEIKLKKGIRKSYSNLVNWGIRELDLQLFDSESISVEQIDIFRQLHVRESGRETRSRDSWLRQLDIVKSGEAFVIFGSWQGEIVSAGFFMMNSNICYYGVSASRRDLFKKPLFHAVIWKAILHAKHLGCRWFENGQQFFLNFPNTPTPTQKEIGISDFKSGFGGSTKVYIDIEYINQNA